MITFTQTAVAIEHECLSSSLVFLATDYHRWYRLVFDLTSKLPLLRGLARQKCLTNQSSHPSQAFTASDYTWMKLTQAASAWLSIDVDVSTCGILVARWYVMAKTMAVVETTGAGRTHLLPWILSSCPGWIAPAQILRYP